MSISEKTLLAFVMIYSISVGTSSASARKNFKGRLYKEEVRQLFEQGLIPSLLEEDWLSLEEWYIESLGFSNLYGVSFEKMSFEQVKDAYYLLLKEEDEEGRDWPQWANSLPHTITKDHRFSVLEEDFQRRFERGLSAIGNC